MALRKYEEVVNRGFALLDKVMPGWDKKIDLEAFDLASGQQCICGQLCALSQAREIRQKMGRSVYRQGFWVTFYNYATRKAKADEWDSAHYGFVVGKNSLYNGKDATWEGLEREWRRQILARRGAES